jgi:hypothetical protein
VRHDPPNGWLEHRLPDRNADRAHAVVGGVRALEPASRSIGAIADSHQQASASVVPRAGHTACDHRDGKTLTTFRGGAAMSVANARTIAPRLNLH